MKTVKDLRNAISRMALHLNPGGVLVVEPFLFRDAIRDRHPSALLVQEPKRKLSRLSVTRLSARQCTWTFYYTLATEDGIKRFTERHTFGLFSRSDYVGAFEGSGLNVQFKTPGLTGRGLFVGVKALSHN